mmetsp:Transcript_11423/g.31607  ORF Transcript_11423/g.31607 Transcript_11423/m.31607 type:complete len:104 (-) Transcript_11423:39-350(-)
MVHTACVSLDKNGGITNPQHKAAGRTIVLLDSGTEETAGGGTYGRGECPASALFCPQKLRIGVLVWTDEPVRHKSIVRFQDTTNQVTRAHRMANRYSDYSVLL